MRVPSLDASLSALVVLASKAKVAETIGAFPHAVHPTLEVTHSWGRHAFQSQTQAPDSCLCTFSVHSEAGWKCRRIHIPRSNAQPMKDKSWLLVNNYDVYSIVSQGVPRGNEPQLVTVIICSLSCPLLDMLPEITSRMNYLHPNLCLGACLWGNPNYKNKH